MNRLLTNPANNLDKQYKSKRNDYITSLFYYPWAACLDFYYTINFRNTERLRQLDNKGFVMLPKHQSAMDIILEGMLLKRVLGRYGNYVMKGTLPRWLEYIGGVSITQGVHLRRILREDKDRGYRKRALQMAKARRDYVNNLILNLLLNEEVVVTHVEGKRGYKEPFQANIPNLEGLLEIQKKLGHETIFLPLNIIYEDKYRYKSGIELVVGRPIHVPNDGLDSLVEHLKLEMANQ